MLEKDILGDVQGYGRVLRVRSAVIITPPPAKSVKTRNYLACGSASLIGGAL